MEPQQRRILDSIISHLNGEKKMDGDQIVDGCRPPRNNWEETKLQETASKPTGYEGFGWIKVKRYVMDAAKDWEGRYKDLEAHHQKEMEFLIAEVRRLAKLLQETQGA